MTADNSKSTSLTDLFKEAVKKANEVDTGEPDLEWPELPEELKTNPGKPQTEADQA